MNMCSVIYTTWTSSFRPEITGRPYSRDDTYTDRTMPFAGPCGPCVARAGSDVPACRPYPWKRSHGKSGCLAWILHSPRSMPRVTSTEPRSDTGRLFSREDFYYWTSVQMTFLAVLDVCSVSMCAARDCALRLGPLVLCIYYFLESPPPRHFRHFLDPTPHTLYTIGDPTDPRPIHATGDNVPISESESNAILKMLVSNAIGRTQVPIGKGVLRHRDLARMAPSEVERFFNRLIAVVVEPLGYDCFFDVTLVPYVAVDLNMMNRAGQEPINTDAEGSPEPEAEGNEEGEPSDPPSFFVDADTYAQYAALAEALNTAGPSTSEG